jgi:hypothetical protein
VAVVIEDSTIRVGDLKVTVPADMAASVRDTVEEVVKVGMLEDELRRRIGEFPKNQARRIAAEKLAEMCFWLTQCLELSHTLKA